MQCILSELMGGNSPANIVVNGSSLFGDFCHFVKITNYNLPIHDASHFAFLYFEWMYNVMSIYIKEAGKITEHGKHFYQ